MSLIAVIGLFLTLTSGSALGAAFKKRRFEELLPLTLCAAIFLLYVFGLFDALRAGAIAVAVLALGCWIAALLRIFRLPDKRETVKLFFTPAFFIYLGLFVFSCLFNIGREVSNWDDLTQWADVVRQMCDIHKFAASIDGFALYPNYPPAMALLQYYVQMLGRGFTGTAFSEWLLFAAYMSALYALPMPFLNKLRYKNWFVNLCLFAAIIALPGILHRSVYRLLEIDAFLGVLAGCALSAACGGWKGSVGKVGCLLYAFTLTLTKSVGLLFALAVCVVLLAESLRHDRAARRARGLLWPLTAFLATGFAWLSWEYYLRSNAAYRAFPGSIDLSVLWRVIIGAEGGYRQEVWQRFGKMFFSPAFSTGILDFGMSFATALAALAVIAILFCLLHRRDAGFSHCRTGLIIGFAVAILYAAGMGVLYLFKFSEKEALELACYDRYMGVPLLMLATLLLSDFASTLTEQGTIRRKAAFAALLAVLLAVAPLQELGGYMLGLNRAYSAQLRAPVDAVVAAISPLLPKEAKKINLVSVNSDGLDYLMFRFTLKPHRITGAWNLRQHDFNPEDIWYDAPETAEAYKARLLQEGHDGVLLYRIDEAFIETYGSLFENEAAIKENCLYFLDAQTGLLYEAK